MTATTAQRPARNGVDVPTLLATLDVVKGAPAAAQFQFRATNHWVAGNHSRTTIHEFFGAETDERLPNTVDSENKYLG